MYKTALLTVDFRSPEYTGSARADQGIWGSLYAYCCERENGGVIEACSEWSALQWAAAGVLREEVVGRDCLLWAWERRSLRVWGYKPNEEERVQRLREINREKGLKSGEVRRKQASENEPAVEPAVERREEKSSEREAKRSGSGAERKRSAAASPPPARGSSAAASGSSPLPNTSDEGIEFPVRAENGGPTSETLEPEALAEIQTEFPELDVAAIARDHARLIAAGETVPPRVGEVACRLRGRCKAIREGRAKGPKK